MSFFSSVTSFFADDDEPDESAATNASSPSSSNSASRSHSAAAAQRHSTAAPASASASTPPPTAGAGAGFFSSLTSAVSSISSSGAEFLESLQAENKDVIAAVNSVIVPVMSADAGPSAPAPVPAPAPASTDSSSVRAAAEAADADAESFKDEEGGGFFDFLGDDDDDEDEEDENEDGERGDDGDDGANVDHNGDSDDALSDGALPASSDNSNDAKPKGKAAKKRASPATKAGAEADSVKASAASNDDENDGDFDGDDLLDNVEQKLGDALGGIQHSLAAWLGASVPSSSSSSSSNGNGIGEDGDNVDVDTAQREAAAQRALDNDEVALEVARTAARARAKLIAMQTNSVSFLFDPADLPSFRAFAADFDLDAMQPSVRGALDDSRAIAEFHAQLVPDQVDERTFWARYFFRVCELQQEEQKRQELFSAHLNQAREEVELTWDDDDEAVAQAPAPVPATEPHTADGAVAPSLPHASAAAAPAVDAIAPAAALVEAPVALHSPPSGIVVIAGLATENSSPAAPIVLAAVAEVSNVVAGVLPAPAEALPDHSAANSGAVSKVDAAPEPLLAASVPPTLVSAVAASVGADANASVASSPSPSSLRTPNDRVDGELRSAAPPATQTLDVTNATAQMASALATESEAVTTTVIVAAAIDSTLAQVSESTSAARSSPEYHLAVIQPQPLVNTDVRDPNSGLPAVVVVKQGIEAQSGSETPIGAKKAAADESDWSEWE